MTSKYKRSYQQKHTFGIIIVSLHSFNSVECARKTSAEDFPRNFALIRLAERTLERQRKEQEEIAAKKEAERAAQQASEQEIAELQKQIADAEDAKGKAIEEQKRASFIEQPEAGAGVLPEEHCDEHNRKLEIICIQDRMRICSTCALFGQHKGHDVRMEPEVVNELTIRTELLIQMYQIVDDISKDRVDQVQVRQMESEFRHKSNELRNNLKEKFNELKTILKIQE